MSLIKFQDWIVAKESSPATRSKTAAALGLGPDVASPFGHSTPPPWQAKRLLGKLKKNGKDSKLPGENPPKPTWTIPEKVQNPDYSFDKWLKDVVKKTTELSDMRKSAEEEDDRLDKEIESRLKDKEKEDEKVTKKKNPQPPPKKDDKKEDDGKDGGKEEKEARWAGQKKEQDDRAKAGIGPHAPHVGREGSEDS